MGRYYSLSIGIINILSDDQKDLLRRNLQNLQSSNNLLDNKDASIIINGNNYHIVKVYYYYDDLSTISILIDTYNLIDTMNIVQDNIFTMTFMNNCYKCKCYNIYDLGDGPIRLVKIDQLCSRYDNIYILNNVLLTENMTDLYYRNIDKFDILIDIKDIPKFDILKNMISRNKTYYEFLFKDNKDNWSVSNNYYINKIDISYNESDQYITIHIKDLSFKDFFNKFVHGYTTNRLPAISFLLNAYPIYDYCSAISVTIIDARIYMNREHFEYCNKFIDPNKLIDPVKKKIEFATIHDDNIYNYMTDTEYYNYYEKNVSEFNIYLLERDFLSYGSHHILKDIENHYGTFLDSNDSMTMLYIGESLEKIFKCNENMIKIKIECPFINFIMRYTKTIEGRNCIRFSDNNNCVIDDRDYIPYYLEEEITEEYIDSIIEYSKKLQDRFIKEFLHPDDVRRITSDKKELSNIYSSINQNGSIHDNISSGNTSISKEELDKANKVESISYNFKNGEHINIQVLPNTEYVDFDNILTEIIHKSIDQTIDQLNESDETEIKDNFIKVTKDSMVDYAEKIKGIKSISLKEESMNLSDIEDSIESIIEYMEEKYNMITKDLKELINNGNTALEEYMNHINDLVGKLLIAALLNNNNDDIEDEDKRKKVTNKVAKNRVDAFKESISKVIFKDTFTKIVWTDGTSTEVKCQQGDNFDKEKGIMLCILKKVLGNTYHYFDLIKYLEKKADEDQKEREEKKAKKLAKKKKAREERLKKEAIEEEHKEIAELSNNN